ncbi:MAG TPA: hypothetical protein EYP53_02640 [Candidatus Latescibacteria bacterium]|nr:hypothetical protein [Candidatus Latescibacterota bacterium]
MNRRFDLTGIDSLKARVEVDAGELRVKLDKKNRFRWKSDHVETRIEGLYESDGYYYNGSYEKTKGELNVKINTGVGEVHIKAR